MQFQKKVIYSLLASATALITSIVIPIIPCRSAPSVPNPNYVWKMCSLNPDIAARTTTIREFFGYTTSLTDTYFLVLLITFALAMIFFHYTKKQKKE